MNFIKVTEQDSNHNDLEKKSVKELVKLMHHEDNNALNAVQKVLPEAVLQGKRPEDHMSVAYGNMMGLIIEALKEMEKKIEKLEGK